MAERGLLDARDVDELRTLLGGVDVVTILDSGHHVMLDQPLALLACLDGMLSVWSLTRPDISPSMPVST